MAASSAVVPRTLWSTESHKAHKPGFRAVIRTLLILARSRRRRSPLSPFAPELLFLLFDRLAVVASSFASEVGRFYDTQVGRSLEERAQGPIAVMRQFQNWIKNVIIVTFCRKQGFKVLDIAAGKGGDLHKFTACSIGLWFAVDISAMSVHEACNRYNELKVRGFDARFVIADCGATLLSAALPALWPTLSFDLVSCQFAMHYFFESETRLRVFFRNVTERLVPGAHFVATTLNAGELLGRLNKTPRESLRFGNDIYEVAFRERVPLVLERDEPVCPEPRLEFGCEYHFHLADVVDFPEYIVWPATLRRVAAEFGMSVRAIVPFLKYAEQSLKREECRRLPQFKKCFADGKWLLSPSEVEAVSLYSVVILQKEGSHVLSPSIFKPFPKQTEADVIDLTTRAPDAL
eukprot:Amastigsp_a841149_116.p2 type:complete len:405 gc:universal Amastigsp_a841149_116:88-1302(+)